jgi:hypothetical protein
MKGGRPERSEAKPRDLSLSFLTFPPNERWPPDRSAAEPRDPSSITPTIEKTPDPSAITLRRMPKSHTRTMPLIPTALLLLTYSRWNTTSSARIVERKSP